MTHALTLGVIGHVDHGKTALVRALTGIETDRLREEKERGLSIVLGFSYLDTPAGVVDLIDAPGHEDFVRTMISGATGIDGVLLCVAANEGLKPQTIEHFQIARLLGIERGIVVLTKSDLVDEAGLEAAAAAVADVTAGTFLADAPVVDCSATTGAGLDTLSSQLAALAAGPVARSAGEEFFLPVDRAFTVQGFGLVVTGTLRGGHVHVGDRVEVEPAGREATIRSLENHGRSVVQAGAGERVAVNLRGLGTDDVGRGDVVATPGLIGATQRIDAELTLLDDSAPLRNGTAVQLLTGTTAVTARARVLGRAAVEPGEDALVQWQLERPIATHASERYIVRQLSPRRTIGGGRFVDVRAERHRRLDPGVRERLEALAAGDVDRLVAQRMREAGAAPIDAARLAADASVDPSEVRAALARHGAVEIDDGLFVAEGILTDLGEAAVAAVEDYHEAEPQQSGIGIVDLAARLASDSVSPVVKKVIAELVGRGALVAEGDRLRRPTFDPFARMSERERQLATELEDRFRDGGLEAPDWKKLVAGDAAREAALRLLLQSGRLVRLRTYDRNDQRVLHRSAVDAAVAAMAESFPYPEPFAVKDVRDLLGSTRRYVVPLMEHLDATGATERSGDLRRLKPR